MNFLWRVGLKFAYRAAICYWFVFRPETKGVYVAVWWGPRILLIKNSYKRKQTFPAGGVKRNEPDMEAALRELQEEVGVRLGPDDLQVGGRYSSRDEYKLDRSVLYETHLDTEPSIKLDQREVVHAEFLELQEACGRELVPVVRQYLESKRNTDAG